MSYIDKGAVISVDQRYRYLLWREWRGTHNPDNWRWLGASDGVGHPLGEPRSCVFVMLNPSTADAAVDDATIRKCVGFAKLWSYERLEVVNLFAYRATDPKTILRLNHDDDPVGPYNQAYFDHIIDSAGIIICAWGTHGAHLGQDETTLGWLGDRRAFALALTKNGHPSHPLYIPYTTKPVRFRN
jgi:hypothetical protein